MGSVNLICSVKTNGADLHIRNGPSLAYSIIGKLPNKTANITVSKEENGWYFVPAYNGWICGDWMTIDKNLDSNIQSSDKNEVQNIDVEPKKSADELFNDYIVARSDTALDGDASSLITSSLEGIYGLPYQFMSSVDPKLEGTMFGQMYADKIISRMPLLLIAPGKVNFMRDYKDKESAAHVLFDNLNNLDVTDLDNLTECTSRYYTFDFDYTTYYKYVDAMCTAAAYFLGIENVEIKINGNLTKIKSIEWENAGSGCFKEVASKSEYVAFYIDSASSVSESFSNSTTESQLSSKVNSYSDMGRELNFLLGTAGGEELLSKSQDVINEAIQTVGDVANKYLNGNGLFKDIANNFSTIAVGGKLIFPEIWSDSDFSNSYDISIKLRTPDGDKLSWFLNIYVPLAHLICMTAPRESSGLDANGYSAPFLVKAFYKGLFNCDMGIITDLSITRGREKAWTLDGLPTEVDVNVTIKDLYNMMSLSSIQSAGSFVNNISLMDYIANSCGINISEPDLDKSLQIYLMLKGHKLTHVLPDIWNKIEQELGNRKMSYQDKLTHLLGVLR